VTFLLQNVRGIKSNDRIEELVQIFAKSNALAACLQETWRFNKEQLEMGNEDHKVLVYCCPQMVL